MASHAEIFVAIHGLEALKAVSTLIRAASAVRLDAYTMLRHVVVLAVAVAVALGMAQEVMKLSTVRASQPVVLQAPPALVPYAPASSATTAAQDAPAPQTALATSTPPHALGVPGEVQKAADGHFYATAEVNGRPVHCLIDTGASFVALTRADAERLGLAPDSLTYDAPVATANGRTRAARVSLDYVTVSGARVEQVPAMVIADGLSTSLLGMSYLGRLSRFEATPSSLLLQP